MLGYGTLVTILLLRYGQPKIQYGAHSFSQEIIYIRKVVYNKFLYVQIITVERWISITSFSIFLNRGA